MSLEETEAPRVTYLLIIGSAVRSQVPLHDSFCWEKGGRTLVKGDPSEEVASAQRLDEGSEIVPCCGRGQEEGFSFLAETQTQKGSTGFQ